MPPPNPRCAFAYTVAQGANDANTRNSLVGEGNLTVSAAEHWFYSVMGHVLPPPVGGRGTISIRLVHYVVELDLLYEPEVRALCASFSLRTATLTDLWVAADTAGLDFTRVSASTFALAAFQARALFRSTSRDLPVATRTIALAPGVCPAVGPSQHGNQKQNRTQCPQQAELKVTT